MTNEELQMLAEFKASTYLNDTDDVLALKIIRAFRTALTAHIINATDVEISKASARSRSALEEILSEWKTP